MLYRLFAVLICLGLSAASAREEAAPEINLSDLTWLEGCWEGTAFGGVAKECWVSGPAGHMTGLFQLENDGELVFTEIMHLGAFENGHGLRVKHFNPDITAWEEKGDFIHFALKETGPDRAVFSGLTFELGEDDVLTVKLKMKDDHGEVRTETLVYERMD